MAAISTVPAGRWAVAVSGGADSVALLRAMTTRPDCELIVVHLDHQLRGEESDADAAFVRALARQHGLRAEIARRHDVAVSGVPDALFSANNLSTRLRAARFAFFADVVRRHDCLGVLLAHHADDQAETVLLRLARGRSLAGLGGMAAVTTLNGVVIRRPLLNVRRDDLREHLANVGQVWREDASNASPKYRRNVIRSSLSRYPGGGLGRGSSSSKNTLGPQQTPSLTLPREYAGEGTEDLAFKLLRLADASRRWRAKLDAGAPRLGEIFETRQLRVPLPFAEHAARQWLVARGAPPERVSPADCRRLIGQATDVTQPPRQHYPGGLLVRRRGGRVDVIPSPPVQSATTHGQEATRTQDV